MSKNYAPEMNARFVGCRVIAHARDETKNRDVRLYALPDSFDAVGVNDGIDCWIAPSSGDPFGAGVKHALEAMWQKGYDILGADGDLAYPFEKERYIAKSQGKPKPTEVQAELPLARERKRVVVRELADVLADAVTTPAEMVKPRGRRVV